MTWVSIVSGILCLLLGAALTLFVIDPLLQRRNERQIRGYRRAVLIRLENNMFRHLTDLMQWFESPFDIKENNPEGYGVKHVSYTTNQGDLETIANWFFDLSDDPKTNAIQLSKEKEELQKQIHILEKHINAMIWEVSSMQLLFQQDPAIIFRLANVRDTKDNCKFYLEKGEKIPVSLCSLGGALALLIGKIREMEASLKDTIPKFR